MRRAALWLCLCALALRPQPALPQIVATNVPPEDQDGSGDDSDNFSGSGAGALQDFTLSQKSPSTWKDMGLLTAMPTAPESTGTDIISAATSVLPVGAGDQEQEGDTVFLVNVGSGFTRLEKTTYPPGETTPHPTTHRVSTTRATTAQAPVTSHPLRDMQPDHHKTSAPEGPGQPDPHTVTSHPLRDMQPDHHKTSAPEGPGQPDPHTVTMEEKGLFATERAAEFGAITQFPAGEGSGEQDFTFDMSGEFTAGPPVKQDQLEEPLLGSSGSGASGASQGLLDRKEVLGGVIAGGLVGLILAVCLVGFMLYRMKKKDEGSYSLEEPKQANGGAYQKPSKQEEFYA